MTWKWGPKSSFLTFAEALKWQFMSFGKRRLKAFMSRDRLPPVPL